MYSILNSAQTTLFISLSSELFLIKILLTSSLLVALILSLILGILARNRFIFRAASRPLVKLGVKANEFAIEAVPKIKAWDTLKHDKI